MNCRILAFFGILALFGGAPLLSTSAAIAADASNTLATTAANTADGIAAAKAALAGKKNLAKGMTATASSEQDGNSASNGVDGDATTRWCASSEAAPQWYVVDLGSSQPISGVKIMWEQTDNAYQYKIETSDDNVTWHLVADRTKNTLANQTDYVLTPNASGRYVRVTATSASSTVWISFFELEVYAK
jgi:hypothetical protein